MSFHASVICQYLQEPIARFHDGISPYFNLLDGKDRVAFTHRQTAGRQRRRSRYLNSTIQGKTMSTMELSRDGIQELTPDEIDLVAGGWDMNAAVSSAWTGAISTGIAGGITGAVLGPAAGFGFGVGFIAGGIGGFIAGGLAGEPKVCNAQQ
ncbi:hypothetical protein [Roseateles sp. MS654]|uniref:hypothetical protein n=1 Tax=Roseateles sp. MS654 TaxID=3412685 RepID=UPI003C2ACE0A